MPRLKNVFLVDDLKSDLLSISQLCDQSMLVNFIKNTCIIINDFDKVIMEGAYTSDNC